MLRKLSILLIAVLLLVSSIPSIFNVFNMVEAKLFSEVKEFLNLKRNEVELEFNKVSFQKLKWFDKNEFEFNNELYDVISIHYSKNKIIITCECDTNESINLKELITEINSKSNKKKDFNLLKLVAKNLCIPESILSINPFHNFKSYSYSLSAKIFYESFHKDCLAPPPKLI